MMNIREYLETIDEEERDEIAFTLYQISQDDELDFENWCLENGIDMAATDENGEYILASWQMDMCGD